MFCFFIAILDNTLSRAGQWQLKKILTFLGHTYKEMLEPCDYLSQNFQHPILTSHII